MIKNTLNLINKGLKLLLTLVKKMINFVVINTRKSELKFYYLKIINKFYISNIK